MFTSIVVDLNFVESKTRRLTASLIYPNSRLFSLPIFLGVKLRVLILIGIRMGSVVEDVLEGGDGGVDVTPSESHLSSVGDEDTKVNSRTSLSSSGKSRKKKNNGGVETPLPTTGSSGGGANNLPNNSTRRIFSSAFKQSVLEAYGSDPECIGNQRATARKFGIHRRQVQKWLTQLEKVSKVHY